MLNVSNKQGVSVKKILFLLIGISVLFYSVLTCISFACTDFQVKATDGSVVIGRSMEFAIELNSALVAHPRGEVWAGTTPGGGKAMNWVSKYGYVSVDAFNMEEAVVDGINEAGLSVGFLWLPEITKYQDVAKSDASAVSISNFGAWVLGNFAKIDELKRALGNIRVFGEVVAQIGIMPPLHVAVHDADGNNLVIEFIDGEMKIHDNPIGVLTNSPAFDWHITNLRNYVNLDSYNAQPVTIEGVELKPTGNGSGLLGIPGDWTPPSRFVRATAFIHFSDPVKSAPEAVNLAEHILNTVDIPHGAIKGERGVAAPEERTQWVVVKDLTNKILYYRTYENLSLRSVNLKELDFDNGAAARSVPMEDGKRGIIDITDKFKK